MDCPIYFQQLTSRDGTPTAALDGDGHCKVCRQDLKSHSTYLQCSYRINRSESIETHSEYQRIVEFREAERKGRIRAEKVCVMRVMHCR